MNNVLPFASVALAALAVVLSRAKATDSPPERGGLVVLLLLSVALLLGVVGVAPKDVAPTAAALGIGTVAAGVVALSRASGLAGFAVGTAAATMAGLVPDARFACLVPLGLAALLLSSEGVAYAGLGAVAVMAADALGPKAGTAPALVHTGSVLGLATVVAGLLALAVAESKARRLVPVALAIFVAGGGALIALNYLRLEAHSVVIVGAALAGLVVHWMLAVGEDSVRKGVATVVWLGLATVAFGLGRGLGMALALVSAAAVLATLQDRSGLLTMAPLLGLVLYRVLRDVLPSPPPLLEATEYQALVGLTVGAVFPLLPADWLRMDVRPGGRIVGLALWGVLVVVVPVAVFVLTGSRGAVGLVVGLGLSGLLTALRGERTLLPLGFGVGAAGTLMTSYAWLQGLTTLPREGRIWLLGAVAIGFAGVGLALLALTPRQTVVREEVA